ncbi:MAG: DUF996 domain-containing protein [Archaeoglobaceae archaeon]
MSVVNARAFGLLGSIFMLMDLYLGYLGVGRTGLLALLGLLLVLIGVKEVAFEANYPKIYRNFLIYFVAMAIFFVTLFFTSNPILLWVLLLIGAVFLMLSFTSIEAVSGISMFKYAAWVYLSGAVLFMVFVGLILLPIALSLQAVAFYSLPDELEQIQGDQFEENLVLEEPKENF